jgi:hypothetical protein
LAGALAAPLLMAGALAGLGPAGGVLAASCQPLTGVQPPSPGSQDNQLNSVAVLSACNAWAVGSRSDAANTDQTLIEHWNGTAWQVVPSPNPSASFAELFGVRAHTATDIWAVGEYAPSAGARDKTLILHWDGHTWKQVASPSPGGVDNELSGVRAVSATDAWAVGTAFTKTGEQPLILRWDGQAWKRVPSPDPGGASVLTGVAATSASNAWAVGQSGEVAGPRQGPGRLVRGPGARLAAARQRASSAATGNPTLILHWDGHSWKRVPSPSPGTGFNELSAVGVTSATRAWAVGTIGTGNRDQTLILRWDGHSWKRVASPNPGGSGADNVLSGVTGPATNAAWAVGVTSHGSTEQTLILHWNGHSWQKVTSPDVGTSRNALFAVAASSPSNVWSVGLFGNGGADQALAVHCC